MSLRPSIIESINKWFINAPSDPRDYPSRKHHTGDRSAPGKYLRRQIQKSYFKKMPKGFKRKRPVRHNRQAKRQKFSFIRRSRRNARRVTRFMRRLGYLREELKLLESTTTLTNVAYDSPVQQVHPVGLAQGDTVNTRDGRKVYLKYLYMKGYVDWLDTTVNLSEQIMRVRIIWVRNTDNAAFNINEVFPDTGAAIDLYGIRNARSTQPFNFKVLYDKLWRPRGDLNETSRIMPFKKMIRINKFTNYSGSGSAETDISNGKLVLHFTSNVGNAQNPPQIFYYTRLRFQDA